ncbi:MAG: hypothetical protein HY960_01215 [Ignavibacteriae bacterium]|nr:hypothetical protein [Ignavibacteriota bacterium]
MKIILISALVVLSFQTGTAQVYPFRQYTIKDGLIDNSVLTLCQDSKGFLWIGTSEGISIFDGVSFTNYAFGDGLPAVLVRVIFESKSTAGVMWIGTGSGICEYEQGTFTPYRLGKTGDENRVYSMIEDRLGILWCGTDNGVYTFQAGKATEFKKKEIYGWVYRVAEDKEGNIWMGGENGLWCYNRTEDSLHTIEKITAYPKRVTAIYPDSKGTIWVARGDSQLQKFHGEKKLKEMKHGFGLIRNIREDGRGKMYCASTNGLLSFRPDDPAVVFERISTENGLHDFDITRILFDREDNLWIAGNGKGLAKLEQRNLSSLALDEMHIKFEAANILVDTAGHYWISSLSGVWEVWFTSSNKSEKYFHSLGKILPREAIIPRGIDEEDNLWCSSTTGEILSYTIQRNRGNHSTLLQKKKFSTLLHSTQLTHWARGLILDSKGRLWFGVIDSGVYCVSVTNSPRILRKFTKEDGLQTIWSRCIFEDRDGNLWLANTSNGVSVLHWDENETTVKNYTAADGLPDEEIKGITQDTQGRMWFAYRYSGVAVLEQGSVTRITKQEGLLTNAVWSVVTDEQGKILICMQSGVQTIETQNFKASHPITILDGNRVYTAVTGSNGLYVMMTPYGISWFDVGQTTDNVPPPFIHLSRFQVNNIDMDFTQDQELPYDRNNVRFDFTGISFKSENRIKYQYQLLPEDNHWLVPTSERSVTYRSLKPGTYTFQVKAISADGVESNRAGIVSFTILQPFWMTWWFLSLSVIILVGTVYAIVRYRIQRAVEIERLRTRLAADLHDEIATNLSSIAMYSKIVQDDSYNDPERKQLLERVSILSNQSVDAIREIIWAIDPRTETLHDLLIRVQDFLNGACHAKAIQPHIVIPSKENLPSFNLRPEQRKNLWLLLKEAINNSMKHSECTNIQFRCSYVNRTLSIEIEDNGKGFDQSEKSTGKGLETMKMRCRTLDCSFEILSKPNHGTKILLAVKL